MVVTLSICQDSKLAGMIRCNVINHTQSFR